MPPKPGPPPRQVSRGRILRRRLGALGAVLLLGLVVLALVKITGGNSKPAPPPVVAAPKPFHIVFPEGFTRLDMAQRVEAVAKIARAKRHKPVRISKRTYLVASGPRMVVGFGSKKRNLEGFLFPATYEFLGSTRSAQLVHDQLAAFRKNWSRVDLSYARKKNLTPYDVLVIASMIEGETIAPDERPLVAAVIYNRLHAKMTLGIDATIRYGLHVPGTKALKQSQLDSDSPYNTRKHLGLPPTPIGNPGLASMQAAAHPAKVDYLYFVRKPDKVHHFFTASDTAFAQYECAHGYGC
jgi:uncharacterized YceG family protein